MKSNVIDAEPAAEPDDQLVVDRDEIEREQQAADDDAAASLPAGGEELVDDIGRAIGITYQQGEPLRAGIKEHDRDARRWELDPASAEDYLERTRHKPDGAEPILHMRHEPRRTR